MRARSTHASRVPHLPSLLLLQLVPVLLLHLTFACRLGGRVRPERRHCAVARWGRRGRVSAVRVGPIGRAAGASAAAACVAAVVGVQLRPLLHLQLTGVLDLLLFLPVTDGFRRLADRRQRVDCVDRHLPGQSPTGRRPHRPRAHLRRPRVVRQCLPRPRVAVVVGEKGRGGRGQGTDGGRRHHIPTHPSARRLFGDRSAPERRPAAAHASARATRRRRRCRRCLARIFRRE
jgi:hypothetical protein